MKNDRNQFDKLYQLHIWYSYNGNTFGFTLSNYYIAGNITFDCNCYTENKEMIHLNQIPVDFKYMEKLNEIVIKHHFAKMKKRKPRDYQPGKPQVRLDISWDVGKKDLKRLENDYWPETGVDELLEFFWDILNSLMGESGKLPMPPDEIISFSYMDYIIPYGGHELCEENGKIRLKWHSDDKKNDFEININTVTVDHKYMDELRQIIKKSGVLEPKPGVLKSFPMGKEIHREFHERNPYIEARWKEVQQSHNQIIWSRNSWLRLSEPNPGSEKLLEFLYNLTEMYAKKATTKFSHLSGPNK
jgi:hypothetical protein